MEIEITDEFFRRMCDLLMHDGARYIVYILEDETFLVIDEDEEEK